MVVQVKKIVNACTEKRRDILELSSDDMVVEGKNIANARTELV